MLIFKNGTIIDPKTSFVGKKDIAIDGKTIAKIADDIPVTENDTVYDCTGKYIGPGLVDVHVHFRDPGFTYKEDIESGSKAAAKGGFTSVILMANTKPAVDNADTIAYILDKGNKTGIHVYTCANITEGMKGEVLTDFAGLLEAGAIGFTDDGVPLLTEGLVKEAMELAVKTDSVLSFHEEDPAYIINNGVNRGVASEYFGIGGSDRRAEISMVDRDIKLALYTGAKVNFQHLSTKEAIELIREAKKLPEGKNLYAEATPHHIALTQEAVLEHGTMAKMNPPLREESDRKAIIEGLVDNTIDIIATDHAPHSEEEKSKAITDAPSGILGLETAFAICNETLVLNKKMDYLQLFCKMSYNPACLYDINAGFLAEKMVADLVVFDAKREWKIDKFASKSQNSPFKNKNLKGKIEITVSGGEIVFSDWK